MADSSNQSVELFHGSSDNSNKQQIVSVFQTPQERQSNRVKKKNILDEEKFVKDLETIIERDFFPDLEKLRIQKAYLTALENNDLPALRELYSKYSMHRSNQASLRTNKSLYSPATFETPDIDSRDKEKIKKPKEFDDDGDDDDDEEDNEPFANEEPPQKRLASDLTLDRYLGKNTSEDNLSFEVIMEDHDKKEQSRVHRSWLFDQERLFNDRNQKALALPTYEKQMIQNHVNNTTGGCLDMWSYTPKNSLMYIPDGAELTLEEKLEMEKQAKIIKHENTRFTDIPFDLKKQKETLEAVSETKLLQQSGKLGVDGKDLVQKEPPKVNGYGYVAATPSPVPGHLAGDESPMMTWGEIESTPFRLDTSTTPYSYHGGSGPEFKIPDVPEREKIALSLEEKANAARRKTKSDALKHMKRSLASPSVDSAKGSLTDRINVMSPAAQRLLSSKLNIRPGSASRSPAASGTLSPSPRSASFSPSIKLISPNNSNNTTPNSLKAAFKKPTDSLTDNLLKLPKKSS